MQIAHVSKVLPDGQTIRGRDDKEIAKISAELFIIHRGDRLQRGTTIETRDAKCCMRCGADFWNTLSDHIRNFCGILAVIKTTVR